jgi:nitroreductase
MSDIAATGASGFSLESVDQVLGTARSVRRRLDFKRPVHPEVLFDCIDLATQAPVGINGEGWRFVVATEEQTKSALASLYRDVIGELAAARGLRIKGSQQALMERLHEVPALVFVCTLGDPPGEETGAQVAFYGSVLPAAWSLMLALRARGLGATWTTLLSARQREVADILHIPEGVVQTVMLPVGYLRGATLRKAERLAASQVTFWNRWGNDAPPTATTGQSINRGEQR